MWENEYSRTVSLIGEANFSTLKRAKVAILGLGGVGSYAAEAIARSGIGMIMLADCDVITQSNLNRQLYALNSTVGKMKTQIARERIEDICSSCEIEVYEERITEETVEAALEGANAVIDAIDDVKAKIAVAKYCQAEGIFEVSAMGTGNKMDATQLQMADIYETKACPLARKMRYELKKAGVKELRCVYSVEEVKTRMHPPASMVFVPASAGILMANEVVMHLLK